MDEKYSELLIEINNNLKLILSALESGQEGGGGNYKIVLYSVPIVGIIFGSTLLFFIFFWWYRQRIELIRANLYRPIEFDLRMFTFFLGLLLTFTGFVLTLVFIIVLGKSMAMLGGLLPLAIGFSLLTFYKLHK
ncbi:MAG: hypothetical protein H7A24_11430 [Leptospiraceae bacterium]|nr:hypothetical protein [Leptospiraceae bacterium]MCP5512485.1 hypothetical protein [Leptospiraceae bacterium]